VTRTEVHHEESQHIAEAIGYRSLDCDDWAERGT
jgi:hypothetical protein